MNKNIFIILLFVNVYVINAGKDVDKCESCDKLVKSFIKVRL
jgi:hypothetical protein